MSVRSGMVVWGLLLAVGCGGEDAAPGGVNPYANNQVPASSAPPGQTVARRSSAGHGGGRAADSTGSEANDTPQVIEVPEAGAAAEMAVPLPFLDYARFARQSSEMLAEMTKIHAAVSESGDAEAYQQRWGELTARHTALARRVVESAYPPVDLARELLPNAIRRLHDEVLHSQAVMEEYDDLEGGLAQPHAQAQRIYEHLTKDLPANELESASAGEGEPQ